MDALYLIPGGVCLLEALVPAAVLLIEGNEDFLRVRVAQASGNDFRNFVHVNAALELDVGFFRAFRPVGEDNDDVDAGAMAKGWRTRPYSDLPLLKELKARRARILLSSDAHRTQDILFAFPDVLQLLKDCGFREIFVWENGGWKEKGFSWQSRQAAL